MSEAETDCALVAHFVKHIYAAPLSDVVLPTVSLARKVAIAICAQLEIAPEAIRTAYSAHESEPLLCCLEIGERCGRDRMFERTFRMMLGSCRTVTRKFDPKTRRMAPMSGDAA